MIRSFEMSDKEYAAAQEFERTQMEKYPAYTGAIGGRFTFMFTVTSIGTSIEVLDQTTGEIKNVTDYDMW